MKRLTCKFCNIEFDDDFSGEVMLYDANICWTGHEGWWYLNSMPSRSIVNLLKTHDSQLQGLLAHKSCLPTAEVKKEKGSEEIEFYTAPGDTYPEVKE